MAHIICVIALSSVGPPTEFEGKIKLFWGIILFYPCCQKTILFFQLIIAMKSLFKLASRRAVLPPTFAGQTHSLDEREVNGLFHWALNLLAAPS